MDPIRDQKQAQFRERVRVRLAAMNTNQADLARSHGMSPQHFNRLINSGPFVRYESLEEIASMLGVTVVWLIDGDLKDGVGDAGDLPDHGVSF